METNPPCKECLVQPTCVLTMTHHDLPYPFLYVKACNDLKEFVAYNEIFTKNEITIEFERI